MINKKVLKLLIIFCLLQNTALVYADENQAHPNYWFEQAKFLLDTNSPDTNSISKAYKMIKKAVASNPSRIEHWEYAALASYRCRDFEAALKYHEKYFKMGGENLQAKQNYANTLIKMEKYQKAIDAYSSLVKSNANDYKSHCLLGMLYNFTHQDEKAIPHLEIVLADSSDETINKKRKTLTISLGWSYLTINEFKKTIDLLEPYIEFNPQHKNIDALWIIAMAYKALDECEKAHEYCGKVLDIEPRHKPCKEWFTRRSPCG
ncbi:MAG: hypothetical protein GY839_06225 [candidate division Zixibacteria bacterium]|nr:hypothetical protein [candidate division Zixibacteria bacterium]